MCTYLLRRHNKRGLGFCAALCCFLLCCFRSARDVCVASGVTCPGDITSAGWGFVLLSVVIPAWFGYELFLWATSAGVPVYTFFLRSVFLLFNLHCFAGLLCRCSCLHFFVKMCSCLHLLSKCNPFLFINSPHCNNRIVALMHI